MVGEKHIRPLRSQIDTTMCLAEQPVSLIKVDAGSSTCCMVVIILGCISNFQHLSVRLVFLSPLGPSAAVSQRSERRRAPPPMAARRIFICDASTWSWEPVQGDRTWFVVC